MVNIVTTDVCRAFADKCLQKYLCQASHMTSIGAINMIGTSIGTIGNVRQTVQIKIITIFYLVSNTAAKLN